MSKNKKNRLTILITGIVFILLGLAYVPFLAAGVLFLLYSLYTYLSAYLYKKNKKRGVN